MFREVVALMFVLLSADLLTTWAAPLTKPRRALHTPDLKITALVGQQAEALNTIEDVFPSRRRRSVAADTAAAAPGGDSIATVVSDSATTGRHRRSTAALFLSSIIHMCDNNPQSHLCARVREIEVSDMNGAKARIRLEEE